MRCVRRLLGVLGAVVATSGCVLGEEEAPGCRAGHAEDCDPGFECRAGACLRFTTDASEPVENGGGGQAGAVGGGGVAGAGGAGSGDAAEESDAATPSDATEAG